MASNMILLMMMVLLTMVLMMRLVLVFLVQPHLHVSLLRCTVQHHVLPLAMALAIHGIGMMRACLGDGRA